MIRSDCGSVERGLARFSREMSERQVGGVAGFRIVLAPNREALQHGAQCFASAGLYAGGETWSGGGRSQGAEQGPTSEAAR
ncbi:hypothetical protein, partial [Pseudomonas syringae group genomosp. 7]|uniref:hypothetical protein n=1 Tax=Pseudomonas syringae group genomosp. 7 TaxID=251699 RepID=UPI00377045C8